MTHSFVICAYEESQYIEECIISLINQTVKSSIIITTSTDNEYLRTLAKKYDLDFVVSDNVPDIARDWNFALSIADTDYVTLAHQDDIYDKNYWFYVKKQIEDNHRMLICFTDYYEIRNGTRTKTNFNLILKRFMCSPLCIRLINRTSVARRL